MIEIHSENGKALGQIFHRSFKVCYPNLYLSHVLIITMVILIFLHQIYGIVENDNIT